MAGQLAAFLGVSAIVIVTPGPDTALTIRNTLLGGRRAGDLHGDRRLERAGDLDAGDRGRDRRAARRVRAGLPGREARGRRLPRLARRPLARGCDPRSSGHRLRGRGRGSLAAAIAFRQGLLSNLGNPKMAAFFSEPAAAVRAAGARVLRAARRSASSSRCMTLVWLTAYAFAVARAGELLGRPAIRRAIEAVTGAVLVALGLRLATERR